MSRSDDLAADLADLLDHYLVHGCPCRFPRFRAHQARDTAAIGVPMWTTPEQQILIALFDRKVPLARARSQDAGQIGLCARCGARVTRTTREPIRDRSIDTLEIRPAPSVLDVGAAVELPIPRLSEFHAVADGSPEAAAAVSMQWPRWDRAAWFAWMRALR